jgi:hypothetical protein
MSRIKEEIGPDGFIWASVDESTDRNGRMMANLIVGRLDPERWYPPHLVSVKPLVDENGNPKVDHKSVARFVDEGLRKQLIFCIKFL